MVTHTFIDFILFFDIEYALTDKVHLVSKADWLLDATSAKAISSAAREFISGLCFVTEVSQHPSRICLRQLADEEAPIEFACQSFDEALTMKTPCD